MAPGKVLATLVGLAAIAGAACGGGGGPKMSALDDQVVAVGGEITIVLAASDASGSKILYSFSKEGPSIDSRSELTIRPDGAGVFKWRPLAEDVGSWAFDFTATAGALSARQTIQIEVRSVLGDSGTPLFRKPLGSGTMLDLSSSNCVEIDVTIDDADTSDVEIKQAEPVIEGARLERDSNNRAFWHWCPTAAQISAGDRYQLRLEADDGSNPASIKDYTIVLRKNLGSDCPGGAPTIDHTPENDSTMLGLTVPATITDDQGFKNAPLFYYSLTEPSATPNLGEMIQLDMLLIEGDNSGGLWAAEVPNPVAGMGSGASATVYYVMVATDNDDQAGDCDHLSQSPVFTMNVTNPGGNGGVGMCESCSADAQCGSGAGDLCVRVGVAGQGYCMKGCGSDSDCGAGYECSDDDVESVDGTSARQCVPVAGTCEPVQASCADDELEGNDTRIDALSAGPLTVGTYGNLVSCPATFGADDDWYRVEVDVASKLTASIVGELTSDLDLSLHTADGTLVTASTGPIAEEGITRTLEPGTYYLRVKAFVRIGLDSIGRNQYTLDYALGAGGACEDDGDEDDDNAGQARIANIYPDPFTSTTNAICSGDDDWYEIELYNDETVAVDLTFDQANPTENLDLHFIDAGGVDLTPCSESNPTTCSSFSGQSIDSNEHYEFTAPSSGGPFTYYVVVRGWAGSENLYDISIALQ